MIWQLKFFFAICWIKTFPFSEFSTGRESLTVKIIFLFLFALIAFFTIAFFTIHFLETVLILQYILVIISQEKKHRVFREKANKEVSRYSVDMELVSIFLS